MPIVVCSWPFVGSDDWEAVLIVCIIKNGDITLKVSGREGNFDMAGPQKVLYEVSIRCMFDRVFVLGWLLYPEWFIFRASPVIIILFSLRTCFLHALFVTTNHFPIYSVWNVFSILFIPTTFRIIDLTDTCISFFVIPNTGMIAEVESVTVLLYTFSTVCW